MFSIYFQIFSIHTWHFSIMAEPTTDSSTRKKRLPTRTPTECRICGVPALYSYFGVVCCIPCKMFFKRNAEHGQVSLPVLCISDRLLSSIDDTEMRLRWSVWDRCEQPSHLFLLSADEMFPMRDGNGENASVGAEKKENRWRRDDGGHLSDGSSINSSDQSNGAGTGEIGSNSVLSFEDPGHIL